jgi:hypothetical protein
VTGSRLLSSREACALLGITYRRLDYWCRLFLHYEPGSGGRRRFDATDLRTLVVIARVYDTTPNARSHHTASEAVRVASENPGCDLLSFDGQTFRPVLDPGRDLVDYLYARRNGMAPTRPTITYLDITVPDLATLEARCEPPDELPSSYSPRWRAPLELSGANPS